MQRSALLLVASLLLSASATTLAPPVAPGAKPALRRVATLRGGAAPAAISAPATPRAAGAPVVRGGAGSSSMPKELKLFIGAAGIFLSFSLFAVFQEDVYKKAYGGEFFAYTFFALVLERGINAAVAALGVAGLGKSGLLIPHSDIFNSGIAQMLAMAASNEALRYVSYPTQVLGKSCKMVPVMAGGIVLGGKRYSLIEYLQVLTITAGVCIFNFGGKSKKGGADSPYGARSRFTYDLGEFYI
jgi:UDP-galactose transporter B1